MPQLNLTAKTIDGLRLAEDGQVEYWDAALKGFGVRVSRTGTSDSETKTFFVRYRAGKRMRRLTIGDVGRVTLADARTRARGILVSVDNGDDPSVARVAAKRAQTFGELWDEYLARHAKQNKRSWRDDERIAKAELLPAWRHRKAKDVTRRDVRDILDAIVDRKAPIMANRTLALARKVFNFGLERDLVENNPCHKIKPPSREQSRERVLSDDEISALWKALDQEGRAGRYLIAAFYRLRLLTAQRGREVLRMKWSDLSQEPGGSVWTVPSDVTKNRRSHRVPLTAAVLEILKAVGVQLEEDRRRANTWREKKGEPLRQPSEWVFPSPRGKAPMANTQKAFDRVRLACGNPNFTAHDLRRTAATRMTGELKVPRFTVGRVLNHLEPGVTGVYDRYAYDDEKRDALHRWGRLVIEGIIGGERQVTKVLAFRSS
jgi:integrase